MAATPYPAYKTTPTRRPDKRYAPSGNISATPIAGWRLRLIRPTKPLHPVGRISGTRHPAMNLACGFGGRVPFTSIIPEAPLPDGGCALSGLQNRSDPVGRISGTRHPAMNLACGFGERVPFTSIIPAAPLPDGGCALSGNISATQTLLLSAI